MGSVTLFPRSTVPPATAIQPPRIAVAAAPAAKAPPATGGRRGEYAVGDIARELGMSHFSARTIIARLRLLARTQRMPLPRTPRFLGERHVTGPLSITVRSRWDAGEIDAWLDGRLPSGPAGAPAMLPQPIRDDMRRRAEQLARVA
ncbi:hypothetical protein S2M10_29600 [Sphingomonas sp. S2M10]|uniref:hypothetical protein n=1 Tax=Sphingomonas sp. S2M10 TaxID=2705010 RepID=UPI001456FEA5|nr:hypothetical protein [Sphingomonas sp. S2M10]NLS27958.1 hypothetical protein [Sphingomonas sp. S2M10]